MEQITTDNVWSTVCVCGRLHVYTRTSPPFSLLEEAKRREKVQAVQVIVDSQLQEVVLREVEQVLENTEMKRP